MNLNFLNSHPTDTARVERRVERNDGFTLLEVLISLAVMVFISFAIYQATIETYKLRETLSVEGDFYNSIRLSISILQRDISLIYSPVAVTPPPPPNANGAQNPNQPSNPNTQNNQAALMAGDLGRSFNYWSPATDTNGTRPSRFVGSEDKLSFISLSHIRIYKDFPESEFAKISYELKKDEKNTTNPDTFVLIKTESPNAFASDDIKDTMTHSYEILHGIKKMTYTYYQRDGNTWKNFKSWDSDKEETKNIVPDIIEVKMEVKGSKTLSFDGKFKFRPEIPFNGLNHSI